MVDFLHLGGQSVQPLDLGVLLPDNCLGPVKLGTALPFNGGEVRIHLIDVIPTSYHLEHECIQLGHRNRSFPNSHHRPGDRSPPWLAWVTG